MLLHSCPSFEAQDRFIWAHSKSGEYSTKSLTLELAKLRPPIHHDAIKGLWKGLVPHRIEVFVWIALMGKINTRSKLATLGITPMENNICPLCSTDPESSEHLLLHCSLSQQLWNWWLELWKIKWAFPFSLKDSFVQWYYPSKNSFFKKVWSASFFIIMWTIWKERNSRIFENSSTSVKCLKDLILLRMGWWIKGWDDDFPYPPTEIQRNPSCLLWKKISPCVSSSSAVQPSLLWIPPEEKCIKWNTDASVLPSESCSAIGGVLRDNGGRFKCIFSSPIPFMEVNSAEILALHRAFRISSSWDFSNYERVIFESDSFNAVSWCNSESGGPWNLIHHLNFIRNVRKKNPNISITHKSRKSNFVADSLAKQGLHRQSEFIAWL